MNNRTKAYFHLFISILIMIFIFRRSALPADLSTIESGRISQFLAGLLSLDPHFAEVLVRKTAHFTEYAVLGASLFINVRDIMRIRGINAAAAKVSFVIPWSISTFYAVTDEIHQHFVPGRSCELRDIVIDACGVAAGVLVMGFLKRKNGINAGRNRKA